MVRCRLLLILTTVALAGGCVEIAALIGGPDASPGGSSSGGGSSGGGVLPGGDGPVDNGGSDTNVPAVRLTVSNLVPQVNEEVILTCGPVGGSTVGLSYAFQTTFDRLGDNAGGSQASFVVGESDIGQELTFTCTATNSAGTSEPSDPVSVFPT